MKLSVFIEERPWTAETAIWIVAENERGEQLIAAPMKLDFKVREPHTVVDPSLVFTGAASREFLPALRGALENAGFGKPPENKQIEAIKYHLEDMRKLVFKGENNG